MGYCGSSGFHAESDGEPVRALGADCARGILTTGVDIVVRKSVTLAIDLTLVNQTAVVVRGLMLIVVRLAKTRSDERVAGRQDVLQEGRADKRSAEPRDNDTMDPIVAFDRLERPCCATPDVVGGGLGVRPVVTLAAKVMARHAALDVAGLRLGVDGQGPVGKPRPDLVDVVVPVGTETGLVRVMQGGKDAHGATIITGHA